MKNQPIIAVIACAFAGQAALADLQYPKQVFDATYDLKSAAGDSVMRMASDGKGHMLTVTTANGMKTRSITDYPKMESVTIMDAAKTVVRTKLKGSPAVSSDPESMAKSGAKAIGTKNIDGHNCHGWESDKNGTKTTTWIGDDTHYVVHSDTVAAKYTSTMSLKSWSTKGPSADDLKVPAGYKEMNVP